MNRVPGDGSKNARILVLGMAPEKNEVATGKPFMGASGQILNNAMRVLGLTREDAYIDNICQIPLSEFNTVSLYDVPAATLAQELKRVATLIYEMKPHVIVPLGDEPLFFITGKKGITKWRGSIIESSILPGFKCVPSVHPAWIVRGMWRWETVFTHIDLQRAKDESKNGQIRTQQVISHVGPTFNFVKEYLARCARAPFVSFDIETTAWSTKNIGHIACLGVGYTQTEALCIPFLRDRFQPYWEAHEEREIWQLLCAILQDEKVAKIGQNLAFEYIYMWAHSIFPSFTGLVDTMLLHHCLYPDFGGAEDVFRKKSVLKRPGHGLAFMTSQYTTIPYYKDDGKFWSGGGNIHDLWIYNTKDVIATFDIAVKATREAIQDGLWKLYESKYQRIFPHSLRMEWDGIDIDVATRVLAHRETSEKIEELQDLIDLAVGYHLNVNSAPAKARFLYAERKYPPRYARGTKGPRKITADREALEYFAAIKQDPVLINIIELTKLLDFRADVLEQQLDKENKMHTHYKIGGTNGARWSSGRSILGNGTNLQNVPVKGLARSLFLAEKLAAG